MKKKSNSLVCLLFLVLFLFPVFPCNCFAIITEKVSGYNYNQIVEDTTKRGKYEKHFVLSDESNIAISYPYQVHEIDESGEWVDFDNSLKYNAFNKCYEVRNNSYAISFSTIDDETVFFDDKSAVLKWKVCNLDDSIELLNYSNPKINNHYAEEDSNIYTQAVAKVFSNINYSGFFMENVDLSYTILPYTVKENVVINHPSDFYGYQIKLSGKGLCSTLAKSGSIELKDKNGNVRFIILSPYAIDARNCVSYDVDITISENADSYTISFLFDQEWLSSPDRVYPIIMDPTVKSAQETSNINDTYVYEGCAASTARTGESTLYIGLKSIGGTYKKHRVFWQTINLPSIANPSFITSASFVSKCWNGTTTDRPFSLYKISGAWDGTTLTWNNMPGSSLLVQNVSRNPTDNNVVFTGTKVTNAIKDWYISGNYGFMIRYTNESTTNPDYNIFYSCNNTTSSSYMPYISITYSTPSAPITGGRMYYIKSAYSGKYLTVNDLSSNVEQYDFVGFPLQRWILTNKGNGYYTFESPEMSAYCGWDGLVNDYNLSIQSSGNSNGTNVKVAAKTNNASQLFSIISCGNNKYRIVPKCANTRCLDVTGPSISNNANIQLWTYESVSQQQWYFEECIQIYQTKNKYLLDQSGDDETGYELSLKEDLLCNDKDSNELQSISGITSTFLSQSSSVHRSNMESLFQSFAIYNFDSFPTNMINHFYDGTGSFFVDQDLATCVHNNSSSQNYVTTTKAYLNTALQNTNGNFRSLKYNNNDRDSSAFSALLIEHSVLQPVFNNILNGLKVCIHDLQGLEIVIKDFSKSGNVCNCKLQYIYYDHFGLDHNDVTNNLYNNSLGLRSWYVLQHYDYYEGIYQPFITVVSFEETFSYTLS